ncbi:hypothetical protein PG999_012401 [Apiospora kogelbergensis]|uniref:Uncharacterized protein n=1 Tax=Apiospora kogelbergensis TaxID=1337665 RepID=A0AAW0QEM8_9PEZI
MDISGWLSKKRWAPSIGPRPHDGGVVDYVSVNLTRVRTSAQLWPPSWISVMSGQHTLARPVGHDSTAWCLEPYLRGTLPSALTAGDVADVPYHPLQSRRKSLLGSLSKRHRIALNPPDRYWHTCGSCFWKFSDPPAKTHRSNQDNLSSVLTAKASQQALTGISGKNSLVLV